MRKQLFTGLMTSDFFSRKALPSNFAWVAAMLWLASGTMTVHAQDAGAQAPIQGNVLIIHAKEGNGETKIDPSLATIEALQRPPFNSFRDMRVLSKPKIRLSEKDAAEVKLPNGRVLRLTLESRQRDGKYLVSASIKTPKKDKFSLLLRVVATPNVPFFVAGQTYDEGTLIVGIKL